MNKTAIFTAFLLVSTVSLQAQIEAPDNLRLQWSPTTQANPSIVLTWTPSPTEATGGYRIERRLGGVAWPAPTTTNALATVASNVGTWTDPLVTDTALTAALKGGNITITYRVRPMVAATPTVFQRASEVVTAGSINAKIFDTDGDGMSDAIEETYGFNPNDWADATGDTDGDGFPNAWEIAMGKNPLLSIDFPVVGALDGTVPWMIDVNPAVAATATSKLKIQDALNALAGGTTLLKKYRVIRVKAGTYLENLDIPENYHVAIIPWRSPPQTTTHGGNQPTADNAQVANALNGKDYDAQEKFELIGTAPTTAIPVIQTTGTFVLDSFRISRTAGSRDAVINVSEDPLASTGAAPRLSMCRLVNCVIANVDAGITALVEHSRSRLVLSHCTFYMNSTDINAPAHSYTTGSIDLLASTARLQVHNSIFWNPINVRPGKPEFQSIGEVTGVSCCMTFDTGLSGTLGLNPGVTPLGYIVGTVSSSWKSGVTRINLASSEPSYKMDVHAPRDIHGEFRYRHAVQVVNGVETLVVGDADPARLTDRGADQWVDSDGDSIPDSADRLAGLAFNAGLDGDSDLLNEVMEYLGSTDSTSADSPYLTLNQAKAIFAPLVNSQTFDSFYTRKEVDDLFLNKLKAATDYLTKEQSDARYLLRNPSVPQTIRVAPGGNLGMGEFGGAASVNP